MTSVGYLRIGVEAVGSRITERMGDRSIIIVLNTNVCQRLKEFGCKTLTF